MSRASSNVPNTPARACRHVQLAYQAQCDKIKQGILPNPVPDLPHGTAQATRAHAQVACATSALCFWDTSQKYFQGVYDSMITMQSRGAASAVSKAGLRHGNVGPRRFHAFQKLRFGFLLAICVAEVQHIAVLINANL